MEEDKESEGSIPTSFQKDLGVRAKSLKKVI